MYMNFSGIDMEALQVLKDKRDVGKLIRIIIWDSKKSEPVEKLQHAAMLAVVGMGIKVEKELADTLSKVMMKKGGLLNPSVYHLMEALVTLGRSDIVAETLYEGLGDRRERFDDLERKNISRIFDVAMALDTEFAKPDLFIWFLYWDQFAYESNKRLRKRALKALSGTYLEDDVQRFIYAIAGIGNCKALFETLGWTESSLTVAEGIAVPQQAMKEFERYKAKIGESSEEEETKSFLIGYIERAFRLMFEKATCVSVSFDKIFKGSQTLFATPDMSYQLPGFCAGCLAEDASKKKNFTGTMGSYGGFSRSITLGIDFCRKCKPNADKFIKVFPLSLEFRNVIYGYLFAQANSVESYLLSFYENEHSAALSKHLKKMGKTDMTRGIPWEMVSEKDLFV